MTDQAIQLRFDYDALDDETRAIVEEEDRGFDADMQESGVSFLRACHHLLRIQSALYYKRPGFDDYCRSKKGLSSRTAYRMIDVARMFAESANIRIESREALYLLASDSTSDDARQEALDRAEVEEITYAKARQIVNEYRGINELLEEANDAVIEQRNPMTAPDTTRNDHVMQVMGSSASPEWYTPAYVVEYVLRLFGVIHVDPCSNSHEHPTVPAETLYTKKDNGLTQPWYGNVYMNPPYGDEIPAWTERLVAMYRSFKIEQAIALIPGRIDTAWFQPLYAYPMCHVRGRIKFQNADNSAPFPSVIVYLGPDEGGFIDTFKELGPIMKRIA